jgi:hypothetical protein
MGHEIDASAAGFMLKDTIEILGPRRDRTGSLKDLMRQYGDGKNCVGRTRVRR